MEPQEQRRRMMRMRAWVRRHDIIRWRDSFFAALDGHSGAAGDKAT
jgi:trehalose-6-phosphate synthase